MPALATKTSLSILPSAVTVGAIENNNSVILDSTTDGIVAHAGGGQTLAVPLVSKANRILTVATANDSVLLPPAIAGLVIRVNNASANAAGVFPQNNGDIINALAVNTAFAQAQGTTVYTCYTTGKWVTN
jgi:hypothetical protein